MEKEFLPYKESLELKELGFDEKCGACYYKKFNNEIGYHKVYRNFNFVSLTVSAPTLSQAFRFFREKYKLHSCIVLPINKIDYAYEIKNISENIRQDFLSEMQSGIIYSSYENAELACIRKLIEIAKEQNVK